MATAWARVNGVLTTSDRLATGLLGLLAVGVTANREGAVLPPAWGWSALGLLLAAALGLAFSRRVEITRLEWAVLGGLTSLVVWIALSTIWSASTPRTVDDFERSIIYVAALAALFVLGSPKSLPYLLGGLLAAVVEISIVALVARDYGPGGNHPLAGPIGYWNALGFLATIGIILALGFASAPLYPGLRLAAAASLPPLAVTLYLTHSRGAWITLGAGLTAFALLHPLLGRHRRTAAVGVVVLALAALSVGVVRAGGPGDFLDRAYGAFHSPPAAEGKQSERVFTFSGNFRADYWRVAWAEYRAHPWLGSGAGTFDLYWQRDRETIYYARDAHNIYLEALAELGPVGLLLLCGTLALPFLALPVARRDPLTAAAVGAYLAFLLHAAVEWDWELPAVMLAGLLCGGGLVLVVPGGGRALSNAVRAVALGAVAIVAGFVLAAYVGNSAARASAKAAGQGDLKQAEKEARTATRWTPWSSEAWILLGNVQLALRDVRGARESFRTGLGKDPSEWRLWYGLARASRGAERKMALAEAARLNQFSREVRALQGR